MADKQSYRPTWTTVTPVKPVEKKTTALPIVPLMTGGTLVAPVLPPAPVKLSTPVTPPVVKKNETPVKPSGPVVVTSTTSDQKPPVKNKETLDYTQPSAFNKVLVFPNTTLEDSLDVNLKRPGGPEFLDKAAKQLANSRTYSDIYDNMRRELVVYYTNPEMVDRMATISTLNNISVALSAGIPSKFLGSYSSAIPSLMNAYTYGTFVDNVRKYPNKTELASVVSNDLKKLSKAGQETYLSLLREWNGSHKELVAAAKSLSAE